MEVWQSLEDWQKLLIGAIASYAIYHVIFITTQSARDAVTRFLNGKQRFELPHYIAAISGNEIHVTRPDGSTAFIELTSLSRVLVATNDSGPWNYDVWFVLEGSNGILEFPLETRGLEEALHLLKQLPGFELRGMNSTGNARFECWPNPQAEPLVS